MTEARLEIVIVLVEKELAIQTLSLEIGTRPRLQFPLLAHLLSPAPPVQVLVPDWQYTVGGWRRIPSI
ncbi:MAG: hypothetical protein WBX03_05605, partial [Terriglobales bacterium]